MLGEVGGVKGKEGSIGSSEIGRGRGRGLVAKGRALCPFGGPAGEICKLESVST